MRAADSPATTGSSMEPELIFLAAAALFAGFVDAVAGGGGLVQLPALFATLPETPAATLFGTNKAASIWGTATAASQYLRRVRLPPALLLSALPAALLGAWSGASTVSMLPPAAIRPAVLVLLVGVAVYTFRRRELGIAHAPRWRGRRLLPAAVATGLLLGFYDGVFGPGTGAFLIFVFVRLFGYDFLHASAAAKLVNLATNAAALAFFAGHGHLLWAAAGLMAVCNVAGAVIGSRAALRFGAGFVRRVFLGVVALLVARIAWDVVGDLLSR
jgi:uncharacterized protein